MLCRYCEKNEAIKNSHIIPSFIFKWIKETSLTGFIRTNILPNKRVQDGQKYPLLCTTCENSFSKLENEFKKFFNQLIRNEHNLTELHISQSSKKCIYSIAWRIIARTLYFPCKNDFTEEEFKKFPNFLNFLKQDIEDDNFKHNIHLIPCTDKVLKKLNLALDEYFYKRNVHAGEVRVWDNWKRLIIFIHIPFLIVIVELIDEFPNEWVGTQIKEKKILTIDNIERIPSFLYALIDHFKGQYSQGMKKISQNQLKVIYNSKYRMRGATL